MNKLLFFILLTFSVSSFGQSLIFRLPFENNGADSSGNSFAGGYTGSNVPSYSNTVKYEGSYSWIGNEYCNWESNAAYNFTDRTFSISCWIRRYSLYGGSHMIFSNKENTGSTGFDIRWDETNQRIYGRTYNGTTPNDFYTANNVLSYDTWYHLVVVFRSGSVTMFLNNSKLSLADSTILTDWTDNKVLAISSGSDGQSANWLGGFIDNFHLYNNPISTAQVDSLYDNGNVVGFELGHAYVPPPPEVTGYFYRSGSAIFPYRNGTKKYPYRRNIPYVPVTGDTVEYFLSENFEDWTNTNVQTLDGLMSKWDVTEANNDWSNQEIVAVTGHGNVWRSWVHTGEWMSLETYASLGDTTSDMWADYDYYVDPNFNHFGQGGCYSGKMLLGFGGGNSWLGATNAYDTVTTAGRGGWFHSVWGSAGSPYPYRRDHIYDYYGCGECGGVTMPKGYWIHVSTHVKINRLGYADGYLETFVNGVMVSKMTGLKTRSLTQGKDFGKFERFIMSFFFGGEHTPCYASPRNQYVQMDNLVVYKYKPGAVNYSRAAKNIGQSCSMISPLQNSFSPDHLMVDESYTNASDTIFDVGNNKFYLYWPPYNKNVITKTVTRPTGANISYTFLSEEFGYPDYGESCEMWVKAYRGIGASKTLISTYGRTGINNGRDPGFVNPSGTYNSGTNTMTFEFHVGCNGGNTRGVAIKYDSKLALCFIGNSTMVPIYNKFVSDAEPYIMTNLAVSGHYINQQLSAWNALSTAQKQSFDYILLQIGLNDCVANDSNTTAAAYQNLVDAIVSSKKASCKIIAATLTPAKGSTVDDDKWLAINRAIRGEGSNAISGIDIIMTSNTTSLDANGDMIMDAAYNSGDNIHPNTAGQAVIKNNWVLTLTNPDLYARSYFVSPSGNDNNPGSFALPWATWDKAFNARKPGDKVYFRGGVYYMTVAGSTGYDRDVVGTSSDSIVFLNYPNEVPILDCDNVTPTPSTDHHALTLHLTYARIRGLVVRNVWQVYPSVEVQALTIVGDHAVVDNCTVYNTHGRGFWIVNSDNTILRNCDSYNNCDSLTAALPGNDGYGFFIQDQEVNTRIVTLIGCRASFCGDDGFTCYSESRVDFKGCWAFNNGQMEGEGHGFKLGWLNTEYSGLRRVVTNCLAANNLSDGINTNDEPGVSAAAVMNVFNNTSYNNTTSSVGGDAYGYIIFNTGSIDARELGRVFRNNLSYANTAGNVFLGEDGLYTHTYNNWDLSVTVNNSDFTSLDAQYLDDSRSSDGDLPNTHGFMELVSGSDLINAGTNVSLPYLGTAPDLGYKEKQ